MATKKPTSNANKPKKAKNLNGTDYDRFAMGAGGFKPANAPSTLVKNKKKK